MSDWTDGSREPDGGGHDTTGGDHDPTDGNHDPTGGGRDATDREWADRLSPMAYRVLREGGTEPAGSSDLLDVDRPGTFRCAGCGRALYRTDEKYTSGTGWPSFWAPVDDDAVETRQDGGIFGFGGRTEVVCAGCGGHLGHVFGDGPPPTGKRHCINGAALAFEERATNDDPDGDRTEGDPDGDRTGGNPDGDRTGGDSGGNRRAGR